MASRDTVSGAYQLTSRDTVSSSSTQNLRDVVQQADCHFVFDVESKLRLASETFGLRGKGDTALTGRRCYGSMLSMRTAGLSM